MHKISLNLEAVRSSQCWALIAAAGLTFISQAAE